MQQAIEKLLKALIAAHGEKFPYIHDLRLLTEQLEGLGEDVPAFSRPLSRFTRFGVLGRYDEGIPLSGQERMEFREIVRSLREFVAARVTQLS